MRVLYRFRFVVVVALAGSIGAACTHTPDEKTVNEARGNYEVAVALMHEAQKAAEMSDQPGRDAKYREALKELLESEKKNPDDAACQLLLGQVYFLGFRRHDDAIVHLDRAVKLKAVQAPKDGAPAEIEYPEAEQMLGVVLVDQGKVEAALPHFEKARTNLLYQTPYYAEQELGSALFLLGRHDLAVQHLQLAIQQQPDLCGAYAKLADVEEARGGDQKQQKVLEDLITRCDNDRLRAASAKLLGPAFFKLGESRLRSGQKATAVDAFRACVTRFPGQPAAQECAHRLELLGVGLTPSEISSGDGANGGASTGG